MKLILIIVAVVAGAFFLQSVNSANALSTLAGDYDASCLQRDNAGTCVLQR